MSNSPSQRGIPSIIHLVNLSTLALGGLILLLAAVVRPYQLVALLPVPILMIMYRRFRENLRVVACYSGLSLVLLGWVVVCEHLVTLDNLFGSQLSQRLSLGLRLHAYVESHLHTTRRAAVVPCCGDPLTYHFLPGSPYRATFDCETCNAPYEATVDETGNLNHPVGLLSQQRQIDLFLAGDSLLQGIGVPSVLEWLRTQIPVSMWSLSIQGYGPRQKVSALLAYALPKAPTWLIIDFNAANDAADELRNDVCAATQDFRCGSSWPEERRRFAAHPRYQTLFELPTDLFASFADYASQSLTLATTRYLLETLKTVVKERLTDTDDSPALHGADGPALAQIGITLPGYSGGFAVRPEQWLAYLQAGLTLTQRSYARLEEALAGSAPRPTVILLYTPSGYELYRDIWVAPRPPYDQAAALQRAALRAFAEAHGWRFVDLTEPLRQRLQANPMWLYGRYDKSHWSQEGTALVVSVLTTELAPIINPRQHVLYPSVP
jgi:hypothetical protein